MVHYYLYWFKLGSNIKATPLTWHDQFVAALAPGGVLTGTAFLTHDLAIIFGSKGLIDQRLVALGAPEAALMPVTVLMGQLLDRRETTL